MFVTAAMQRAAAIGAVVQERRQRRQLLAAAAACPEVAVKGSAAAAVVAAAIGRAKAPIPPALEPPSFALQLCDTSSSHTQWLILKMRLQGVQLMQLLPKLLPLLLWAPSPTALCFSVLRTGTRRSSWLR